MLKNMKIRKSLILAFGITILLSVVIIVASLFMMVSLKEGYQQVINRDIRASELITYSRLNANIAARNVRDMALFPDDPTNADKAQRINDTLTEMSENLKELRAVYPLTDITKLNAYLDAVEAWGLELPDIMTAVTSGDIEQAKNLIENSCTPHLNEMASLAQEVDTLLVTVKNEAVQQQEMVVIYTIIIMAGVLLITAIFVLILATKLIRSIIGPTEQIRKALVGFSEGDLRVPVQYSSKNELGEMCDAMRRSQQILGGVIDDECYLLEEMARGNFDLASKDKSLYVGSLSSILKSIQTINHNLSDTLAQISQSAEQVSAGAEQVSTSAQALAQGATEQASAVEELSATISEISTNAKENAKNSEQVMAHTQSAGKQAEESAKYMTQMVEAMRRISDSSEEISKIIATIENIAFQTNILALNAAVEAARAGVAGKGFAVVADEVRNLASKSDQASKATKDLIERSIVAVKEGEDIVNRVSEVLGSTVEATEASVEGIRSISGAVEGEAESIAQVVEGIDQISSVVQTNSATSEESAAASEELSSQAALMKELMSRFKLRSVDNGYSAGVAAYAAPQAEEVSYEVDSAAVNSFSKY